MESEGDLVGVVQKEHCILKAEEVAQVRGVVVRPRQHDAEL